MAITVTIDQLGAELRRKRSKEELSLRDAEAETGISAATLSRIERGSVPDTLIIERLAKWLEINVTTAGQMSPSVKTDEDLRRTIAVHLRANKKLPPSVAQAIVESFDLVMRLEMQRARTGKHSHDIG
jgi:transcriptional regulator with XRE-family HTH domain